MASAVVSEAAGREYSSCIRVQPSPETSLYFMSPSDYLQHLIRHGVCYADARVEPCGPRACQLQVKQAPPPLDSLISGGTSMKTLLKHSSTDAISSPDEQGFTPLLYAALNGAHDIAAALLKAGVSPDSTHATTGASALSLACLHNHPDIVKQLLKHRASSAMADGDGCSPLHCAVWAGSGKAVKLLLSQLPALIAARDQADRTVLHYAAARGDVAMCQLLLKKGAKLSEVDSEGRTTLHWAILSLQLSCVEYLLANATTLCDQSDNRGATPAHYAAMTGQCEMVTALENRGGDMAATDSSDYSPLLWACACGHVDIARQLLELKHRGIPSSNGSSSQDQSYRAEEDTFPATEGGLCLRTACGVGSLDVCQLLIQTSDSVARVADEDGVTALHTASRHGHTDCLDEVLEAGAAPDAATHTEHRTSLHIASERGYCEVVSSLLAAGANCDCSTQPDGERPLHLAARNGHANVIQELINRGCTPDIRRANDGQTPLHVAADVGHIHCCRLLVERGADPTITETSIQSCSALDLALDSGHREVADYLISQGAPSSGGIFHRAALTIQAVWRLHRHRRRCCLTRQWSAVMIQRAVRRWMRRRMAGRVRAVRERTRNRAAVAIQQSWRWYMEGKRRYEATSACLRARLHQEYLVTTVLMEELRSQAHSIQLSHPPTTAFCLQSHTTPITAHKAPPTPGYLLQASAPLPTPLISSAALLSPTRIRRPLSFPMKPRRSLTPHHLPPQHHKQQQEMGVSESSRLPSISLHSSMTAVKDLPMAASLSVTNRGSSQLNSPSKTNRGSSQSINTTSSLKTNRSSSQSINTTSSLKTNRGSSQSNGSCKTVSKRSKFAGNGERKRPESRPSEEKVDSKLPPLPLSPPSLTSPPPLTPSLTSPPPPTSPHCPPTHINAIIIDLPSSSMPGTQLNPLETDRTTNNHLTPRQDAENSEQASTGKHQSSSSSSHQPYMKQTVFRAAQLGQQMGEECRNKQENVRQQVEEEEEGEKGGEGEEGGVDRRLLGPIQRYDRLNHVLSLLQQVQGAEEGEVRLSSLRDHIQSALDEAVRLRADTDSLQLKLTHKPTNNSQQPSR